MKEDLEFLFLIWVGVVLAGTTILALIEAPLLVATFAIAALLSYAIVKGSPEIRAYALGIVTVLAYFAMLYVIVNWGWAR
ncbi:MAG: hypothetical protein H0Z18_09130 [Thermococcus sp.]|uniref:hypothetical protein n=1 Tax=Thermococcus sp. TaxID=35749 RepID=UPI001DCF5AB9|nr:hypothetical protein [Thermococcus sp.]MBO8175406.1 hypothetical protein [Thermococcus sp.]